MIDQHRRDQMLDFLEGTDWRGSEARSLAGDASNRRYYRAKTREGHSAVIMDAAPEKGEDTTPFLHMAAYLSSIGLSPPRVLDADSESGFVLLEDLGDNLFAKWLQRSPSDEVMLYEAAVDALIAIARAKSPSNIGVYDARTMAALAGLAGTWYAASDDIATEIAEACETTLNKCPPSEPTLALRDYHAENLIWLPDRKGVARVGLLDFQDASLGYQAYDLASLIKDARRDVETAAQEASVRHFSEKLGIKSTDLTHSLAAQGAQRSLRILGVFARLSLHFGKAHYVDLIPRVWRNLIEDLNHPALENLRFIVTRALPEPTKHHLNDLRKRCGTIPMLA